MNQTAIDIVITWVDDRDESWRRQRDAYSGTKSTRENTDAQNVRYRDWDNLQYLFRGIETNAPWVRYVYFVTWGHLPPWLNTDHPKLRIVRHEDFLPKEFLPTFNSSTIMTNLFRIPGLAEQYVLFNDDMFLLRPTVAEDFFCGGLPCDMAGLSPQPIKRESICNIELNNLKILNDYFSTEDIRKHKNKWLCFGKYGQYALRTLLFMQFKTIIGIFEPHIPISMKKSTAEKIWKSEGQTLFAAGRNKFRSTEDYSEWLYRMWQLASGEFVPRNAHFGKLVPASDGQLLKTCMADKRCKVVCINDDSSVTDFEAEKTRVNQMLKDLYPRKSAFEK